MRDPQALDPISTWRIENGSTIQNYIPEKNSKEESNFKPKPHGLTLQLLRPLVLPTVIERPKNSDLLQPNWINSSTEKAISSEFQTRLELIGVP